MRRATTFLSLALLLVVSILAQAQDDTIATTAVAAEAAAASASAEQVSCRVHVVNNTASPASNMLGHVRSSLKVLSAADIMDVSVILQVQHPDVAALEVTLTAAATSKDSSSVTLKSPAAGVGGANMIQTIFSDYAPSPFPNGPAEAPFSSVYRPAQPLSTLVTGASTAAGAGGSQGVWTLTVTDTAATKRPLKLTGWELWLCGASNGPLFASDVNATAFDGEEVTPEVSIVRKRVAVPSKRDVAAVLKSAKRSALAAEDPAAEIVDQINTFVARQLAAKFEPVQGLLDVVSPALSKVLQSNIATSIASLKKMPGLLGYLQTADGRFELPTSEAEVKTFIETFKRCYNDLYWCWQKTGLQGNFAQDFVATWEGKAKPVAATWAAVQDQWLAAITDFEANDPALAQWGDALFYSTIGALYRAAQLDAVATVAEAWTETAIRLALYISPIRFAVNPRAFVFQTVAAVSNVLRSLFGTFANLEQLTDADNNNDIPAITEFTRGLVAAQREMLDLLTLGIRTRAEGMQAAITASAGGLANSAASMNERVADTLSAFDPRLGAIFNSSTDGINSVLRNIGSAQQDAVERYFRATNSRLNLGGELDRTLTLAGEAVVQTSTNMATALKAAQEAVDGVVPGPNLQQVIVDLRSNLTGILSDGRTNLAKVVPVPELQEMDALMTATVRAQLDLLDQAATAVSDGPGAQAIGAQLGNMASNLQSASQGVSQVLQSMANGFPGPMLNSTLASIRQQSSRTVTNIERMFGELARQYPTLDPANFIAELSSTLEGLMANTFDLTSAFENLAGFDAAQALGQALPASVQPVIQTVTSAAAGLPALVGATAGPNRDTERLSQLQSGIGKSLEAFAGQIRALADSLPNRPPVRDISDRLSQRSSELGQDSSRLSDAIRNAVGAPSEVVEAGIADMNNRLENLVKDLRGQNAQAAQLGEMLGSGPLATVATGLNTVLAPVTQGFEAMTSRLPPLPEVRQILNSTISPAADVLGAQVKQASRAAVNATANINNAGLSVLARGLEATVGGINQAQLQIATLMNAGGQLGEQLAAAAPAVNLSAPLAALDSGLASTVGQIANQMQASLAGFGAPEEVMRGVVEPLARQLDSRLTALLNTSEQVAPTLQDVLTGTTGIVRDLAGQAARALGVPQAPRVTGPRHLLQAEQLAPISLPAGFNVLGFNGAIGQALANAASQFANTAVASANGRPGLSAALGGIQEYIQALTGASTKLDGLLSLLPQGRVMSVILDSAGGKRVIDSLASLQEALKQAPVGQAGPIVDQISAVLSSLGSGSAGVGARPAVQAALQAAAKQLLPNGGQLLSGFMSQLSAALSG